MNENETISELNELLKAIKAKPGLYIGIKSLVRLRTFIDGFLYAVYLINGKKRHIEFYPDFQNWIAEKYHIRSTHGWCEIINFYELSEEKAFDRFYELLNEFFIEKNINIEI